MTPSKFRANGITFVLRSEAVMWKPQDIPYLTATWGRVGRYGLVAKK